MANRRMFSKDIVDSDKFYDLPIEAQALYFHLGLNADDDGFIEPKRIARLVGIKIENIKPLLEKELVIAFESGVVVITDWRRHNYIRKDTYNETQHKYEKSLLQQGSNEEYILSSTPRQRLVNDSSPQDRLGKDRLGKDRLGKDRLGENAPTHNNLIEKNFSKRSDITDQILEELANKYEVPMEFVVDCWDSASNWLDASAQRKKNYKAFLSNWVKKERAKWLLKSKTTGYSRGGVVNA